MPNSDTWKGDQRAQCKWMVFMGYEGEDRITRKQSRAGDRVSEGRVI